jgi:hypothetical protein
MLEPIERILVLGPDLQLRVSSVPDSSPPAVELRLFRRSPDSIDPADFHASDAGLRCPVHLVPSLNDCLISVARRAVLPGQVERVNAEAAP